MKKSLLTGIVLFSLSTIAFSQTNIPLKYSEIITRQNLKKQLSVIASDEMEGRKTGTEGQRKAAVYIEGQFRKLGLEPPELLDGFQQYFGLMKDTLIPQSFKIGNSNLYEEKDYVLLSGSSKKESFKSKEIIFAGYGIIAPQYNDYKNKNVRGKVVVILSGEPKGNNKYLINGTEKPSFWSYAMVKKVSIAKEQGAVAVLFVNTDWDSIPSALASNAGKKILYFPESNQKADLTTILIPPYELMKILGKDNAEKILKSKEETDLNKLSIEEKIKTKLVFVKSKTMGHPSNMIGIIEGTDKKDEYVFITAHYDHLGKMGNVIYYGANDDGSGTAAVIEMAHAFAKAKQDGVPPRRTIVFMLFSGEEEGLLGSQFYAQYPVFPLQKTSVDLNTDMIGRLDPNRKYTEKNCLYLVGNDKISSELSPIVEEINDKYCHLRLDYKYNNFNDPEKLFYRSDHYSFAKNDVPVIFFTSGLYPEYHKPSDTVDKINFDIMQKRVQFIFLTAWKIANMDEMLKRDLPLPKEGI